MATKDDDKDLESRDDADDEDEDDSSPPEKKSAAAAGKAADDDDDEGDDDDSSPPEKKAAAAAGKAADDDDDGDDDDDEPPAKAAPAAKDAPASSKAAGAPAAGASKAKPGAATSKKGGPASKGAAPAAGKAIKGKMVPVAPVKKKGSLGTSMVLFVIVVGGLAAGFAILGRETGGPGGTAPKWKVGQDVDVEITLVKTDRRDLTCASSEEIGGRHCAFESKEKRWSKPDKPDDKKAVLQPYTTTGQIQFVGAGLWSEPALDTDAKLPATRFAVKCKLKVEGQMKKPSIRWHTEDPWADRTEDWYTGLISGCSIAAP